MSSATPEVAFREDARRLARKHRITHPHCGAPASSRPVTAVHVNIWYDAGKLMTIIDLADGNKCMIDGPVPKTGVARQVIPFKRLALTDIADQGAKSARQKTS